MTDLFSKVASYVRCLSTTFLILDTILLLVFGGLVGALLQGSENAPLLFLLLVLILPVFIAFMYIKAYVQKNFPAAAVEELRARYELHTTQKNIARKRMIDGYIDTAIQSLNQQTCSLSQEAMDELCEQDIEDGLRSVIAPVIQLPNYLLDCSASDFTVGSHLKYSSVPPPGDNGQELCWYERTFLLRDDLDLGGFLCRDLLEDRDASGIRFELRNALHWTLNHREFHASTFCHEESEYTIITSPIPQVCEGEWLTGVLFIVVEQLDTLPEDLDRILLIFNRILGNWLSRYDECNTNKLQSRASPV